MNAIKELLAQHGFFSCLENTVLEVVASCAKSVVFTAGSYLATHGQPAENFFLIQKGRIAINTFAPGQGSLTLQTLTDGEVFGWSWIFPPYQWTFDAVSMAETTVLSFDGHYLRERCEADSPIGYAVMKQFAHILVERLVASRIQVLDLYRAQDL